MDFNAQILRKSVYTLANALSKLFFVWVVPLFIKGYGYDLKNSDLFGAPAGVQSSYLGNFMEELWHVETTRAANLGNKPSLLCVCWKMCWKKMAAATVLFMINSCAFLCAQPIFLRLLIVSFENHHSKDSAAYTYAGLVCLLSFLNTLITQPGIFLTMYAGMQLRVATSALIYRKLLRLNKAAQGNTSSGQIVNLLSNDCGLFDVHLNFLPYFIIAPFQVCILVILMYQQVGPACLAGVVFIIMLLPFQYFLGKYSATFRGNLARQTDKRGRLMNEIISAMRVIKQYAWEKPFSVLVEKIRKLEVQQIRRRGYLKGAHQAVLTFSPKIIQFVTFIMFVLFSDEPLSADKVFFTMTCLHTMTQIAVQFTPLAAAGFCELLVAVKRIQDFLLLDEQSPCQQKSDINIITDLYLQYADKKFTKNCPSSISLENVNASWPNTGKLSLQNFTFTAGDNSLVIVVGPVGCCKSTLLLTILQEIRINSGCLKVNGSISYASQEPWIFAGTLRQNILFGQPYDKSRYDSTLKACCLDQDLKQLPHGDMTLMGERGVALSGGQKARVNLARAIYQKSDIYLLDEPLAAIDSRVSRKLFGKCIKGHLKNSLRILVTHQLQYLPQADYIAVMQDGKIQAQGKYQEIVNSGIDLCDLLTQSEEPVDVESSRGSFARHSIKRASHEKDSPTPVENLEQIARGSLEISSYKEYLLAGHSIFGLIFLVVAFIVCQLVSTANDYWLSYWTNAENSYNDCLLGQVISSTDLYNTKTNSCEGNYFGEYNYVYVSTALVLLVTVCSLWRGLWFYLYFAQTSASVHDSMIFCLIRAPISFFDENPSGRILNRLTKDLVAIDEFLPPTIINTFSIILQVLGVLTVVIISNYYMAVPSLVLLVIMYLMRRVFVRTARDIKRIESVARSPIFSHITTTMQGLTTIRVSGVQSLLIKQFEGYQDMHSAAWFIFLGINRCFGMWLELLCDTFLTIVAFGFLMIPSSVQGGNVGLSISSLLSIMGTFQWGMRQSAEMENYMTSAERVFEYSKITPEAEPESDANFKPPDSWPMKGKIEFFKVSLSYQEKMPVLKNLTFEILPFRKIGIVGRTGAGKSSIISALFRLTEPQGKIIIDGVDIKTMGLHDLRQKISLIPQDPVLFSGTIRFNLDPFQSFPDNELWDVIKETELTHAIHSLDMQVEDGGANFSVGQRQLLCLARAILRKNRILIMDEATASVDNKTDLLIQNTTRSKFINCKIIIIAHRLQTIMDCDKVLVLDYGEIKEYDHPHKLLQTGSGIFSDMVKQTGRSSNAWLRSISEEAFNRNIPQIE